jgi:hypothetical protein
MSTDQLVALLRQLNEELAARRKAVGDPKAGEEMPSIRRDAKGRITES